MGDDGHMPLSLDEVHDLIDSWVIDPREETLGPANSLFATMAVGDPGRLDVLQVIADHQALRGEIDAALATLDQAAAEPGHEEDIVQATRAAYLIQDGRDDESEPLLLELRRRGAGLPWEALERVADALEEAGRLREAMRWFTIGLRDLDPSRDVPDHEEEFALIGRWRVREALELPPDHYDNLAHMTLDARRARWDEDWG
jgi:tetratricopeptide (TPR) repeat protein